MRKKKIGIMTLNGYENYGNRLQNFALQYFLQNMNNEVETIIYHVKFPTGIRNKLIFHLKQKDMFKMAKQSVDKLLRKHDFKRKHVLDLKRENNFKKFSQTFINETSYHLNQYSIQDSENIDRLNNFDCFFVGSDQVWNLRGGLFPRDYFLPFVPTKKRNSFAASFGFSKFENSLMADRFGKYLNEMDQVSVREEDGAKLVNQVSDKTATVLLDPTMLLTGAEWEKMMVAPKVNLPEKFVVTYFLGKEISKYRALIEKISEIKGVPIIRLNDINFPEYYELSPAEFLYILNKSEFTLTDSFHGTVFSILFKNSFFVLPRVDLSVDMSSRITTLLNRFGLEDCTSQDVDNLDISVLMESIDFNGAKEVLNLNRQKSIDFVKAACGENDDE